MKGYRDELYIQLYTSQNDKWREGILLKAKSEAPDGLAELVNIRLAAEGLSVLEYFSDGAPELISRQIVEFLASKGCKVHYSPPYTPERNGLSEISKRIIWEAAHAMMLNTCLPLMFWTYAVMYAIVINNFLPTNTALGWMSPYQARYGKVPDVSVFRTFGCVAYIRIDQSLRDKTLVDKAYKGYFIGLKWPLVDIFLCLCRSWRKGWSLRMCCMTK